MAEGSEWMTGTMLIRAAKGTDQGEYVCEGMGEDGRWHRSEAAKLVVIGGEGTEIAPKQEEKEVDREQVEGGGVWGVNVDRHLNILAYSKFLTKCGNALKKFLFGDWPMVTHQRITIYPLGESTDI